MTPAEVISRTLYALTLSDADVSEAAPAVLAALAEQGYTIVRAEDIHGALGPKRGVRAYIEAGRRLDSAEHPAQPSGTLQDAQTSGDGITGPLAHADGSTGLSALREELWQHRVAADVLGTLLREEEEASSRARTRAEHAEEALDAAQQTIARTVRYAIAQHAYRPVEAGSLAAVLLNIDPHDIDPDEAIRALETQGASLTEEKPHA